MAKAVSTRELEESLNALVKCLLDDRAQAQKLTRQFRYQLKLSEAANVMERVYAALDEAAFDIDVLTETILEEEERE